VTCCTAAEVLFSHIGPLDCLHPPTLQRRECWLPFINVPSRSACRHIRRGFESALEVESSTEEDVQLDVFLRQMVPFLYELEPRLPDDQVIFQVQSWVRDSVALPPSGLRSWNGCIKHTAVKITHSWQCTGLIYKPLHLATGGGRPAGWRGCRRCASARRC